MKIRKTIEGKPHAGNRIQAARPSLMRMTVAVCVVTCASGAFARNIIPNGSFENGSTISSGDYAINNQEPYVTDAWRGGILTRVNAAATTFCSAPSVAGTYAMALHKAYPQVETSFSVAVAGTYDFSFHYTTRTGHPCGQYVSVFIDDSAEPVCRVLPSAAGVWDEFRTTVSLAAGAHTLKFIGELAAGVNDTSTVIDLVRLEYAQGANLVPNHSFECNTMIGLANWKANEVSAPITRGWTGGIITKGETAYCKLAMADDVYGLAIDGTHSASCTIQVPQNGTYRLSFKYAPCKDYSANPVLTSGGMGVSARIDGNEVATCTAASGWDWQMCDANVSLTAGEHSLTLAGVLSDGVTDSAVTIDFVSLLPAGANILPNGGFEDGSSTGNFAINDNGQATSGWTGGILTRGNTAMCSATMAEGTYGLALHDSYPTLTRTFEVTESGNYTIRFKCVGRAEGGTKRNLRVLVFIDDLVNPIYAFVPESVVNWDTHEFYLPLATGSHTVLFRGELVDPTKTDSSTVIDGVSIRRAYHGVYHGVCTPVGPGHDADKVPGVFVDENDVLTFNADRVFAGDVVYGAIPEVQSQDASARTKSGRCEIAVGTSVVAVDWPYVRLGTFSTGLIPNGSFESGSSISSGNFAINNQEPYVTDAWRGGILTEVHAADRTRFCSALSVAGSYAMALHNSYPQVEASFSLDAAGTYDLSFLYAPRTDLPPQAQRVALYIDNALVTTVIPSRRDVWDDWFGQVSLSAGAHTIRFVGTLEPGMNDGSTVIEAVFLTPTKREGFVILFK